MFNPLDVLKARCINGWTTKDKEFSFVTEGNTPLSPCHVTRLNHATNCYQSIAGDTNVFPSIEEAVRHVDKTYYHGKIMAEYVLSYVRRSAKSGKEVCIYFEEGDAEQLWVHPVKEGIFLDSQNAYDSSAFPSETEPLLKEAGIPIEYETYEWAYGFHATATEEQFLRLLSVYTVFICGERDYQEEQHDSNL